MEKRTIFLGVFLLILLAVFSWLFFEIASNFNGTEIRHFDNTIISNVQGHISDRLTSIMLIITFLGSVKGVAVISTVVVVAIFIMRHRLLSLFLVLSIAIGAGVFNRLLKYLFKRERPDIQPIIQEHGYSFPSGHSMGSMILYGSLAFVLFKLYKHTWAKVLGVILGIFMILIVGISRIYLGVHYPSDVIGGYVAGAFWLLICITVFSIIDHRRNRNSEF